MPRTVTQNPEKPNNDDFLSALERWEGGSRRRQAHTCESVLRQQKPYSSTRDNPGDLRYEKESYLRIDFSKAGKVTFYAEFPKKMGLKGRKLGKWPELAIQLARENAVEMAGEGLRAESVHLALESYRADLEAKVQRQKLSDHSYRTYCARIKQIDLAFGDREVFGDVTYGRIIEVLDTWIATKSNNHALELFAELRRFWKYSVPQLCNGRNVAASIPDDYVSSRVQRPAPTRLFTDIESIAKLWLNVAGCTSIHQKNVMRFMILTGGRPINVSNLQWNYVREDIKEIVYPAGIIGMRGAMKTQKEFRIPITAGIERILQEQKEWRDSVPGCNQQFVFLQPRNPELPFAKRSLGKLIKTYSPENAVKGIKHDGTVKGREGAFNTMCRKFFKSNVIAQMRAKGFSRSDTREISLLCLHHSDKSADPMAEHYDFSDEILQEEMALKKTAFEAHEASILTQVILLRKKG